MVHVHTVRCCCHVAKPRKQPRRERRQTRKTTHSMIVSLTPLIGSVWDRPLYGDGEWSRGAGGEAGRGPWGLGTFWNCVAVRTQLYRWRKPSSPAPHTARDSWCARGASVRLFETREQPVIGVSDAHLRTVPAHGRVTVL